MPIYTYVAIDSDGKRIKDNYTADNKQDVIKYLREQNLFAMSIETISAKEAAAKQKKGYNSMTKITSEDLYLACRQFYTMLHSGISLLDCLETVAAQAPNKRLQDVLNEVKNQVSSGSSLSEALGKHKALFPSIFLSMIETGEVTGNLEEVMSRLSDYFENEYKTGNVVKSSMIYPCVLLILTIVMVIAMLIFVLPTFAQIFEDSGAELPAPTKILLGMSDFMIHKWYVCLISVGVISGLIYYVTHLPGFTPAFDKFKLKLPVVKEFELTGMTFRMTRSLSILLTSGVNLVDALEIASHVAGNTVGVDALIKVRDEISQGSPFGRSLARTNLFPSMLNAMVAIGEASGSLDSILDEVADYYQDELNTAVKNLVALLEPLMIIIMACGIGAVAMAILLPMFSMTEAMG